jgi:hypothetical protein
MCVCVSNYACVRSNFVMEKREENKEKESWEHDAVAVLCCFHAGI